MLATLEYLAESGLRPDGVEPQVRATATYTASGNVSEHSVGQRGRHLGRSTASRSSATRSRGGITEQTVRRLMRLQGTMRPHQIISLLDFGANTLALADHYNHIHVGFHAAVRRQPQGSAAGARGAEARPVVRPASRGCAQIDNPVVPTTAVALRHPGAAPRPRRLDRQAAVSPATRLATPVRTTSPSTPSENRSGSSRRNAAAPTA